jgi:hypothetical protein
LRPQNLGFLDNAPQIISADRRPGPSDLSIRAV